MRWTNLGDLVDRSARLDSPAIIDLSGEAPRTWTHADIDALANGIAIDLTARGLPRGAAVAILSLNRAEYLAAYFGIMRAGFVAVPVNTKLPQETIDFVLRDAGIVFSFVDTMGRAMIPETMPFLDFDEAGVGGFADVVDPVAEFPTVAMDLSETAQILYTSGSTGRPKGVLLSHGSQLWPLSTRTSGAQTPNERYIIAQPLFHMNGLFSAKTIFANNASVVVMPSFDARAYLEALADYEVTAVTAVPTMFARLLKNEDLLDSRDYSRLTRIMLGSAPITEALIEKIQARFPGATMSLGYGTTEAGPAVFGPHPDGLKTPPTSVGYPLGLDQVRLIDGPGADEGVLMMRNPSLMTGYGNLPEKTAEVMRDGWYYSGDVMRRDENGFYYFVGRADDMFVCSGENIYPAEVETMLEKHPGIQYAAVVPLADEERGQVPVAFVVPRPGQAPTEKDIKSYSLTAGPAYQHPRRIKLLPELPWAGTNKVDRRALIAEANALELQNGWEG